MQRKDPTLLIVGAVIALAALIVGGVALVAFDKEGATAANSPKDIRPQLTSKPAAVKEFEPSTEEVSDNAPQPSAKPSVLETLKSTISPPGRLRVTVTWEYNQFVGNKPDTDATIMLIPSGYAKRLEASFDPVVARIVFDSTKKMMQEQGVYIGIVGGDGKALIADIPAGTYTMIIISKHTNDAPEIATRMEKVLARYFKDGISATVHKVHVTEVKINSDEESEYSYDFGNTYI